MASSVGRQWAWITGLRALLMLLAGIFLVISPSAALPIIVIFAGAMFLVDGILGVWSLTFGGGKSGNYWFDVIRNILSIIVGVLILIYPLMSTIIATTYAVYIIGIQAIIVGVMEIWTLFRSGAHMKIWPVLLMGIVNVLFGLLLLLFPITAAVVMLTWIGILMIVFSIGLFALAWRLWRGTSSAPAV